LAGSAFILGLGILCSVFDLAYLGLLLWARQNVRALDSKSVDQEAARSQAPVISPNGAVTAG
ncbi:MAG TPA: hypothetical protein VFO20_05315, partial [Propionibacteriaceae bacterium]|nr:hypothetical protein [Propionibacteriaceae bacterium]